MQSLYLLILLFFIIIIVFPLGFNIKLFFSIKSNKGAFSIFLWKIKIKSAKVKFHNKNFYLIEKTKLEEKEVEVGEPQLRFLKFFNREVNEKIKIRKIEAILKCGLGDPFKSAITVSSIASLVLGSFARLKVKQPTATYRLTTQTEFYDFCLLAGLKLKASLSIFDVLYSFVISLLKSREKK